jgi:hypothetical protein
MKSNYFTHLIDSYHWMGLIEDITSILKKKKKGGHKITLETSYLRWNKEQWSDLLRKKFCFMQFYQVMSLRNVRLGHLPSTDMLLVSIQLAVMSVTSREYKQWTNTVSSIIYNLIFNFCLFILLRLSILYFYKNDYFAGCPLLGIQLYRNNNIYAF